MDFYLKKDDIIMMSQFLRFDQQHMAAFGRNSGRFLTWGIILMILGLLAVTFTTWTTLISVTLLGFFLFFSGAVVLIDTLTFWRRSLGGFFVHLFYAALYLIVGVILLNNPVEGSISITFLLGAFYLFIGLVRIVFAAISQMPRWGWSLFNGIVSLLLGILILASWPASSLFIIGLFVGIDLFFSGWAYVMASLAARNVQ